MPLFHGVFHQKSWLYAFYRLRYFSIIVMIRSLLQVLEFAALYYFVGVSTMMSVVLLRGMAYMISAGYWGALEILRTKVRVFFRCREKVYLPGLVRHWVWLAALIGLGLMIGYLVYRNNVVAEVAPFYSVYALCIVIQLVLQLMLQTFHSAVYALRRVVRPSFSIYLP